MKTKTGIVFLIYLLIAIFITGPIIFHLKTYVIGILNHPGLQGQLFFIKVVLDNFQKGRLFSGFTDLVNYPYGQDLKNKIHTFFILYFTVPFSQILGIIPAYNLFVILVLALNGFMMYILGRKLFKYKLICFVLGFYYQINTYTFLKITQGFLQKICIFWIPLCFLFLFRFYKSKKLPDLIYFNLFLYCCSFTYAPYAYYLALFCILLFFTLVLKNKFFMKPLFIQIASFLILVFIFGYYYFPVFKGEEYSSTPHLEILRFYKFYPYQEFSLPGVSCLPLGISIIVLLFSLFSFLDKENRKNVILLFLFFLFWVVISMGGVLTINGNEILFYGHRIFLPGYLIYKYFPFGEYLIFPIRVFPFINIALSLLMGYGLSSFSRRKRSLIIAAVSFIIFYLGELFLLFPEIFPLRVSKFTVPRCYQKLKNHHAKAILVLSLQDRAHSNKHCMYASMNDIKLVNAYDFKTAALSIPCKESLFSEKQNFITTLDKLEVDFILIDKDILKEVEFSYMEWIDKFCSLFYSDDSYVIYRVPKTVYRNQKKFYLSIIPRKNLLKIVAYFKNRSPKLVS